MRTRRTDRTRTRAAGTLTAEPARRGRLRRVVAAHPVVALTVICCLDIPVLLALGRPTDQGGSGAPDEPLSALVEGASRVLDQAAPAVIAAPEGDPGGAVESAPAGEPPSTEAPAVESQSAEVPSGTGRPTGQPTDEGAAGPPPDCNAAGLTHALDSTGAGASLVVGEASCDEVFATLQASRSDGTTDEPVVAAFRLADGAWEHFATVGRDQCPDLLAIEPGFPPSLC